MIWAGANESKRYGGKICLQVFLSGTLFAPNFSVEKFALGDDDPAH
jgi:hypothetical protein